MVGIYHRGSSVFSRVIYEMKYARRPQLALDTMRYLLRQPGYAEFFGRCDIVVPVPTTWWRRWIRGYNPAQLLSTEISRTCSLPLEHRVMHRGRGRRQSRTRGDERTRLEGLPFAVGAAAPLLPEGCRILLVDDVATTGTTLSACALALKKVRPDVKISVFTLAWAGK
jgi:predicted amidophosphoribosyltransferase